MPQSPEKIEFSEDDLREIVKESVRKYVETIDPNDPVAAINPDSVAAFGPPCAGFLN